MGAWLAAGKTAQRPVRRGAGGCASQRLVLLAVSRTREDRPMNMKVLWSLAVAALALAACSRPAPWKEYAYADQQFAVAFPAPPKSGKELGPLLTEMNDGKMDFGVTAACNIPPDADPANILASATQRTAENGHVHDTTMIALSGATGRQMLIDQANGPTVTQRLFVRNGCLYVIFAASKDGPNSEAVTRFLSSFRFL
jgi:hypothetical protein